MKNFLIQINILIIICFVWSIIFSLQLFSPLLLPSPTMIVVAIKKLFTQDRIITDILYTLYRLMAGIIIGSTLGLILGFSFSLLHKAKAHINFWLDFLRSLPYVAIIPIFMLFFGFGDKAKIYLIAFVCLLITMLNVLQAIKNVSKTRIMSASTMGLNKRQIFYKIILPESLAYISAGSRHLLSFAVIITIISEMFMGAKYGLGKKIIDYHLIFSTDMMYATIILTGIIGYVLNKTYELFERRTTHWVGK